VQLHWLVYPAAGSALLHYVWKQKADFRGPIIAGVVLAVLFALRVWWRGRDKAARADREGRRNRTPDPQGQPG
jgi:DMSO/TMAO reductase YedYZ heme-binding membrane subunit